MIDSGLLLYDAPHSPAGRRVRITLFEKGLVAEIRWLDLALMEQKRPEYLRLNPSGVVPTLVHGSRILFDSGVICEYLDALHGQPTLVPVDHDARLEMRQWIAFEQEWARPFRDAIYEGFARERLRRTGLAAHELPARLGANTSNPAYLHLAIDLLSRPGDPQVIADRIAVLMERLAWMEERLADGRTWLLGERYTLADIALAPRLDMFPAIGVHDIDQRFPRIGTFLQRVRARPSWAATAHVA
jgi:glutathione S-transferase